MSIKRIFLFAFISLYCIFVAKAQVFEREITWNPSVTLTTDSSSVTFLQFEGADFNDKQFPVYSELLKFPDSNKNYSLNIDSLQFIAISDKDIENIRNLEQITNQITFTQNQVKVRSGKAFQLSFVPIRKTKNGKGYEKLTKFSIILRHIPDSYWSNKDKNTYTSVLANGNWYKFYTQKTGVHQITFEQLGSLGFTNPAEVHIFGNSQGMLSYMNADDRADDLRELNIEIKNNSIYFFATDANKIEYNASKELFMPIKNLYTDNSCYFITDTYLGNQPIIKTQEQYSKNTDLKITDYDAIRFLEDDLYNLAKSGRNWYGNRFDINLNQSFDFNFPNAVSGTNLKTYINFAAFSPYQTSFSLNNGSQFYEVSIGASSTYDKGRENHISFVQPIKNDAIQLNVQYKRNYSSEIGWLDKIIMNATCALKFTGGQMLFQKHLPEDYIGKAVEYQVSNANSATQIWDITDPVLPQKVGGDFLNGIFTFKTIYSANQKFVAFDGTQIFSPTISGSGTGSVENQDLHGTQGTVDYIIISHPNFLAQAEEIAKIHKAEGLEVLIVTPQQIFNEFSSGMSDVSAMRDFVRMVYLRGTENDKLKYLLLLGDGSYDNKNYNSLNTNFILTYQSENSLSETASYVTDDFFGLLDENEGGAVGLLDIGIGRIPVKTVGEAQTAVNKIKQYLNPATRHGWRNTLCFLADDEDSNVHMRDADVLTENVKNEYPDFNIDKIYFDAYPQIITSVGARYPAVNEALTNTVQKGALIINYTGHGGEYGLAHERILTISEIEAWENFQNLPLFVTATCEFSRYDNFNMVTAGERVFLNPKGGAIAMFTTTRLVYVTPNFRLNKAFYKHVFQRNSKGNKNRLGDIIRLTKNDISGENKRNFTLLGDPALELLYGENSVKTNTINGNNPENSNDTIQALSKVKITGEVQKNGVKLSDFNGFVDVTIYDKEKTVKTLNNDFKSGAFSYLVRNNAIYKGTAIVKSGDFSFEFIVPKDIKQNIGIGKISYYAYNAETDGKGSTFNFNVGGYATTYEPDNQGPEIKLFINDTNFISGGITNSNPMIFAKIFDVSGINTVGNGIGHDITAVVDGNTSETFILNDDYKAEPETFQYGEVSHFLYDLPLGNHELTLKAWDVYNNSSEASIEFKVIDGNKLVLTNLINAPNPFSENTNFYFEHNKSGQRLKVSIQLFSMAGHLVGQIDKEIDAEGFRVGPISTQNEALNLRQGIYIYRISVTAEDGKKVSASEKMIVVK